MNTQQRILLIIALIAAGGIALLVYAMSGSKPVTTVALPQQNATTQVLVANADIPAGQTVRSGMVSWRDWPSDHIPASAITGGSADTLNVHISNSVANTRISKGMPVLDSMLIKTNSHGYMASVLSPGMRAISLPMSVDRAVAGFIRPTNHVDLLLTRSVNGQPVTNRLLDDVILLAIDQTVEEKPDAPPVADSIRTITLEVTPEQAELLTKAHMTGTISVTLRPLMQTTDADRYDKTGPITIIRGGPAPDAGK